MSATIDEYLVYLQPRDRAPAALHAMRSDLSSFQVFIPHDHPHPTAASYKAHVAIPPPSAAPFYPAGHNDSSWLDWRGRPSSGP